MTDGRIPLYLSAPHITSCQLHWVPLGPRLRPLQPAAPGANCGHTQGTQQEGDSGEGRSPEVG